MIWPKLALIVKENKFSVHSRSVLKYVFLSAEILKLNNGHIIKSPEFCGSIDNHWFSACYFSLSSINIINVKVYVGNVLKPLDQLRLDQSVSIGYLLFLPAACVLV